MTAARTGRLMVYVADEPIDDAAIAAAKQCVSDVQQPAVLIHNLLEPLYDASLCTREAAQILGRMKSTLKALVGNGLQIVVLCQRRPADLSTRSHFVASLCAAADHVHFRRST
jgi:hypothetical protein